MQFTVIEGIISGLDRTTQVSGGGDSMSSTTHCSIFSLTGERVLLKTAYPPMIADGDHLKLTGVRGQGQFTAIACRNVTTGWVTTYKAQGCALAFLIGFGLVGLVFTLIFPLFIFIPVFVAIGLFRLLRTNSRLKTAHMMVRQ